MILERVLSIELTQLTTLTFDLGETHRRKDGKCEV